MQSQTEEFRQSCVEALGCFKTPQLAESELTGIEDRLLLEAKPTIVIDTEKSPNVTSIERKQACQGSIWNRTNAESSDSGRQRGGRAPGTRESTNRFN